jgi:hypothetical protein
LLKQSEKSKIMILQALRWKLTKAESIEYRQNMLGSFIKNDIFDLKNGKQSIIIDLLNSSNEFIRMSTARILNAFASLNEGS